MPAARDPRIVSIETEYTRSKGRAHAISGAEWRQAAVPGRAGFVLWPDSVGRRSDRWEPDPRRLAGREGHC